MFYRRYTLIHAGQLVGLGKSTIPGGLVFVCLFVLFSYGSFSQQRMFVAACWGPYFLPVDITCRFRDSVSAGSLATVGVGGGNK